MTSHCRGVAFTGANCESFCGPQEPTKQIDVVATAGVEAACGPFLPKIGVSISLAAGLK